MSAEVCWGDPNKSAFEGSQGWILVRWETNTHACLPHCQPICMSEPLLSFSLFFSKAFITCLTAFWAQRLQDYASPLSANCNHNILQHVRLMATHTQRLPTRHWWTLSAWYYTTYSEQLNIFEEHKLNGTSVCSRELLPAGSLCAAYLSKWQQASGIQGLQHNHLLTNGLHSHGSLSLTA